MGGGSLRNHLHVTHPEDLDRNPIAYHTNLLQRTKQSFNHYRRKAAKAKRSISPPSSPTKIEAPNASIRPRVHIAKTAEAHGVPNADIDKARMLPDTNKTTYFLSKMVQRCQPGDVPSWVAKHCLRKGWSYRQRLNLRTKTDCRRVSECLEADEVVEMLENHEEGRAPAGVEKQTVKWTLRQRACAYLSAR